ncbi:MAG: L,D-transpeptidase [Proteobacteria bacterium]|nr:L,D-transpeptidase [Pseudomonadota bacterium]
MGTLLLASLSPGSAGAAADPGLVLELDREQFALTVRDARDGRLGPQVTVALGSPANPTPLGNFSLSRVILNPAWRPGATAREAGAEDEPPSLSTPMGVAKIPFAAGGAIALHGAGDAYLLGKPVSSGCVRASDADLLQILAWLHERRALAAPVLQPDGEVTRRFQRPARLIVR